MPTPSQTNPPLPVVRVELPHATHFIPARTFAEAASKVSCAPGEIWRFSWMRSPVKVPIRG